MIADLKPYPTIEALEKETEGLLGQILVETERPA